MFLARSAPLLPGSIFTAMPHCPDYRGFVLSLEIPGARVLITDDSAEAGRQEETSRHGSLLVPTYGFVYTFMETHNLSCTYLGCYVTSMDSSHP